MFDHGHYTRAELQCWLRRRQSCSFCLGHSAGVQRCGFWTWWKEVQLYLAKAWQTCYVDSSRDSGKLADLRSDQRSCSAWMVVGVWQDGCSLVVHSRTVRDSERKPVLCRPPNRRGRLLVCLPSSSRWEKVRPEADADADSGAGAGRWKGDRSARTGEAPKRHAIACLWYTSEGLHKRSRGASGVSVLLARNGAGSDREVVSSGRGENLGAVSECLLWCPSFPWVQPTIRPPRYQAAQPPVDQQWEAGCPHGSGQCGTCPGWSHVTESCVVTPGVGGAVVHRRVSSTRTVWGAVGVHDWWADRRLVTWVHVVRHGFRWQSVWRVSFGGS